MGRYDVADQGQGGDPVRLASDQVIMAERLAHSLSIPAGARVLDIGFGHSGLHGAIAAGRRRAEVTAIHFKQPIIDHIRARAEVERIDGIAFISADISNGLPVPDASFDFVISTLGIVFVGDQHAAAKELARVVKPGGRIGLTAFSRTSMPSQIYDLMGQLFPHVPRPARHHYEWADGPRVGDLLASSFNALSIGFESYDSCFASAQECLDTTAKWNVNVQNFLARASAEDAAKVKAAQLEIMHRVNRATDGSFIGPMEYGVITGVRAG